MIKVILVEDEKSGQELLRNYITRFFPTFSIVHIADNVQDAQESIEKWQPDLVFLDVHIKGGFGTDVLNYFPDKFFTTIFITAYDDYAVEAFRHEATDYLLKPINAIEFQERVQRALDKMMIKKSKNETIQSVKIGITTVNGQYYLDSNNILYLKADGAYTHIHTHQDRFISSKNLGDFEKELGTKSFFRIHHSYIVNLNHINEIEKSRAGILYLKNGEQLPISQRKIQPFLSFLKESQVITL